MLELNPQWRAPTRSMSAQFQPTSVFDGLAFLRGQAFQGSLDEGLHLTPLQKYSVPIVNTCVRSVSEDIAGCRWSVMEEDDDGRLSPVHGHRLDRLLNYRPNQMSVGYTFKQALLNQALIYGNAYARIQRDPSQKLVALWVLPSEQVRVVPAGEELSFVHRERSGRETTYSADEMVHIPGPSLEGAVGDPIFERASRAIAIFYAAEKFSLQYFNSNATLGMVLTVASLSMTPAQREDLEKEFSRTRSGLNNAFKTLVLPAGSTATPFTNTAKDAQLVEAHQKMVEDVLAYFRMPATKVGLVASSQNYGRNIIEFGVQYVTDALQPWCHRVQQELTVKLIGLSPDGSNQLHVVVDTSHLTRGDRKTQAETAQALKGIFTVNELRADLGKAPVDGGDDLEQSAPAAPPSPAAVQTEDDLAALAGRHIGDFAARLHGQSDDARRKNKNGMLAEKLAGIEQRLTELAAKKLSFLKPIAPDRFDDAVQAALLAAKGGGDPTELGRAVVQALREDRS